MINRLILYIKKRGFQERLVAQFMLLVMVPLIVMGILSYNIYVKGETAKDRLTFDSHSESIVNEYENILAFIRQYYLNCTGNSVFTWLVRQTEVPYSSYYEVRQAQLMLNGDYFMSEYIDMYNFINVREGWVLNRYGMFPYSQVRNIEVVDAFMERQMEEASSIYWLNRSEFSSPYQAAIESYMIDTSGEMLIVKDGYHTGSMKYLLMIKLNMDRLKRISKSHEELGYDVTVLSGEEILIETNPELTNMYLTADNIQKVQYKVAGETPFIMKVTKASSSGLTYIVGYDTNTHKIEGTVFIYAAFALIFACGILFALLNNLAKLCSKPFFSLQKFAFDQNEQIRELFLFNLIKGELNREKIAADAEKIDILPCHCYRMIVVSCKNPGSTQGTEKVIAQPNRINGQIVAMLPDNLKESLFISPVFYENVAVFIVGEEEETPLDYKTALIYKQIKDFVSETLNCPIACGISRVFHNLINTSRAYSECLEALYYWSNSGDAVNSSLALYDDFHTIESVTSVYDIIMESELCEAIDNCKEEEASRLLEIIISRMELKGVMGLERSVYLSRLVIAILSIPGKASISLTDVFGDEEYNVFNRINQIYNQTELSHYLTEEIVHPIIASLTSCTKPESSDVVKAVLKLIKETEGTLFLNECADSLNYHPNYISRVLKKEEGVTFTDLVKAEKIKLAKYMLLTTDYSIAEISDRLQYNNVQNFIRFFKSQLGTTPAAFRKEHRE